MAEKVPALKKVVFQENLGTVYDKVERLGVLAEFLGKVLNAGEQDLKYARRAAYLAKARPLSPIWFTNSLNYRVIWAGSTPSAPVRRRRWRWPFMSIICHGLPGTISPSSLPGQILSISDKIDNITGCFAIGIQPSGSEDPYALRRQALGICHIILGGTVRPVPGAFG